jgi:hypothetical protein
MLTKFDVKECFYNVSRQFELLVIFTDYIAHFTYGSTYRGSQMQGNFLCFQWENEKKIYLTELNMSFSSGEL